MKELVRHVERQVLGFSLPVYKLHGKIEKLADVVATLNEYLHIVSIPSGTRSNHIWGFSDRSLLDGWLMPVAGVDMDPLLRDMGRKAEISLANESLVPEKHLHLFKAASAEEIQNVLKSILEHVLDTTPVTCLYWKYAEENLLPASVNLEAFKANPKSCEPLRAMFKLAGEKNASLAIGSAKQRPNGVKNLLTRVARATTKHLKGRWKELGGVEVVLAPNGENIDAAVRDEFNEYSFSRRSDGFKRFVSFLILISARSATDDLTGTLFIQDEPDLGLHPTGVRSLLEELIKLSHKNYALISTHSIFMIDKNRIDRHVVVEKVREETVVSAVDYSVVKDEEVLYNALGYSLFDIARPCNVIFEGWRDKKLFETFLAKREPVCGLLKIKMKSELGLTYAMGVKDAPRVAAFFQSIGRSYLIVSDSDETAVQKQRQYLDGRQQAEWRRYDELRGANKVLTAEDFILPSRLRSALAESLDRRGVSYKAPDGAFEDAVPAAEVARQLVAAQGFIGEASKAILNEWKSNIFDELSAKNIRESYNEVATGISDYFNFSR